MGAVAAEPCVELGFGGVDGGGTLVSFPAIEVVGGGGGVQGSVVGGEMAGAPRGW
jgi:hypothetical protein